MRFVHYACEGLAIFSISSDSLVAEALFFFIAIFDAGSKLITSLGQFLTHCGSPPQRSHLNILCVIGSMEQPPKGHAMTHRPQPTHRASSTETRPVSLFFVIAFRGHTFAQIGSSHCWQVIGMSRPFSSHFMIWIRERAGVTSATCRNEHHVSHCLHPAHFSASMTSTFCMLEVDQSNNILLMVNTKVLFISS